MPRHATSITCALTFFVAATPVAAQSIVVQPYLQTATPSSIWVMWETSSGEESRVEWGPTMALGNTANGSARGGLGLARVHETQITGLTPATKYYYRVHTGGAASPIHHFHTPPAPTAEQSFRLVAMSDMQIDRSNRQVFERIVRDGVVRVVTSTFGADLSEHLGLVMIPGDLVDSGLIQGQWRNDFFDPAAELLAQVPSYPVPGNHELDSALYFRYFHLPDNGTVGFEEHWYYTDYSNLRVIGLDSNGRYRTQTQLDWLDDVLTQTCMVSTIDFVFAQLHHPSQSELWPPGEADFTTQVVRRLEAFSSRCGKPSIHFYGHTHGYARGQSRDHQHLWVNVASAGGNLDYWGEYAQRDYPETTVSQDEWGFVLVDVQAGAQPQFRLQRISHGDEMQRLDNVVRDEITVRKSNTMPLVPTPLVPAGGGVNPDCFTLDATAFVDADRDGHGATQWQISTDCADFSTPVRDLWRQHENWYRQQNTQANDDLTDEVVRGLQPSTDYCWRARYRDRGLVWSDWSTPTAFTTATSSRTGNLLTNPGAESSDTGWTVRRGVFESLTNGQCSGVAPHAGSRYFASGLCRSESRMEAFQPVDVSFMSTQIDTATVSVIFGGWLRNYGGSDRPEVHVRFMDGGGTELGRSATLTTLASQWTELEARATVPANTRSIEMTLEGTRNAGTDNDSYFDDLDLRLDFNAAGTRCDPGMNDPPPPTPDAGVADAGVDAGMTGPDAGGTGPDAGELAPDATTTAPDAETTAPDAEAPREDAAAPPPDATAGPGADAAEAMDAGADAGALPPAADPSCSCRAHRRSTTPWTGLLLLFALGARRRRPRSGEAS